MKSSGYSGTPLVRKLGVPPRERITALGAPVYYRQLLGELPEGGSIGSRMAAGSRFVHLFATRRGDLVRRLTMLRNRIAEDGVLWVSWPKKASNVASNITEDVIREVALPLGFVDVKVCAVDETWSGLKLMIRRTERTGSCS
jgi:hypothetical protein